jgi:succinate dehydrogenase/fumarate reductase iron-sulfur protein
MVEPRRTRIWMAKNPDRRELIVQRWNHEEGKQPHYQKFEVPWSPDMSVLDALLYVSGRIDGTLAVNHSCGKQRCGSCAMKIDDKIALACFTPIRKRQVVSPLPGFRVVRDLVVDWRPYEERMYDLIPRAGSGQESVAEPEQADVALAESVMTCIKCFACVGACPSVEFGNPRGFAGPAISVMLTSYIDDSERQPGLSDPILKASLEFCTKCFACNAVCPAEIDIVGSINRLQRLSGKKDRRGRDLLEMVQGRL